MGLAIPAREDREGKCGSREWDDGSTRGPTGLASMDQPEGQCSEKGDAQRLPNRVECGVISLHLGQAATLAGLKPSGGHYNADRKQIRDQGLVGEKDIFVAVNELGLDAIGEVPPTPSTAEERLALWCSRLPSPADTGTVGPHSFATMGWLNSVASGSGLASCSGDAASQHQNGCIGDRVRCVTRSFVALVEAQQLAPAGAARYLRKHKHNDLGNLPVARYVERIILIGRQRFPAHPRHRRSLTASATAAASLASFLFDLTKGFTN